MDWKNLNQVFLRNFVEYGDKTALMYKTGGRYQGLAYRKLGEICKTVARGLIVTGFEIFERAVILSNSRPEWAYADLGALLAGGITSAIYTQSLPPEIAYILNDLEAGVLFVEDEEQLEKIVQIKAELKFLRRVYVFSDSVAALPSWAQRFGELITAGKESPAEFNQSILSIADSIEAQDPACIIYTSGTTGASKGVVLTHGNYLQTMNSVLKHIANHDKLQLHFSFLPLAHSFERLAGHYLVFYMGRCVAYTESMETIGENIREVRPNIISAVPRFFEKVYARIMQGVGTAPRIKRKMFYKALAIGEHWTEVRDHQKTLSFWESLKYRLAERFVFRKVRKAFGGRLEFCISGGAPLSPQIARFFYHLGILILEGWGATEATAPTTINKPGEFKFGSVGKPIPNVHIRVAEDGELEVKGPNIFKEYWKKPEDTQDSFTPDGYYRTGDIGVIDRQGWVYITDRKKQIIVTAGGKNVAPAAIEQLLNNQPHIEMSYIHGDRRKYLTALITLDETALVSTAQKFDLQHLSRVDLREHPRIQQLLQSEVDLVNEQLPRYMQIKYFRLLPEPFSMEKGELTHTQKLRKKIIEEKYRNLIDSMYPAEI